MDFKKLGNIDSIVKGINLVETPELQNDKPCIHIVEVTAPMNVPDKVVDRLHSLCEALTDEELAYAVVYINDELKMRQEDGLTQACVYEDDEPEDEYEND